MIYLKDLWVGDQLLLKSSGRVGKFVSIAVDGRARIDISGKIVLSTPDNLEVYEEKDGFPDHLLQDLLEDRNKAQPQTQPLKIKINHTIDLHIEKLSPNFREDVPGQIIDYQMKACKAFVEEAIARKLPHITIIHGKGQGILKTEVESLLKSYNVARFLVSKNQGGALEVWLG
jgi:DNA-nicking Smr family endonuclease